jgi:hypothetical protein
MRKKQRKNKQQRRKSKKKRTHAKWAKPTISQGVNVPEKKSTRENSLMGRV